ncbi:MAG: peptidoglycan DD-metalloendopeptidase family protein [Bacilli bacterium]
MNKKNIFKVLLLSIVIASLVLFIGVNSKTYKDGAENLYKVYLDGKMIGLVNNKESLYDLIDNEQESLKKDFDVDKIYPPKNLKISAVKTYNKNVTNINDVYNTLKNKEPFSIEGYEVTIEKENPIVFNILKKEDFDEAIKTTIRSFVNKDTLELYLKNAQAPILDEGSIIDRIRIEEEISIKKTLISTKDIIYKNSTDISEFLLFGASKSSNSYIVKPGETVEDISYKNNLNVDEFLIVNPNIVSENALLFPGQSVSVALVNPLVTVVVEETSVEKQAIKHETKVHYDSGMTYGTTIVKQSGQDGLAKSEFKFEIKNGMKTKGVNVKTEQIIAPVDEIVYKGGQQTVYVGDSTYWAWPTLKPYCITSLRGWRWGRFHDGVDIACVGHGSPIFSIQAGTVVGTTSGDTRGNCVTIDHNNGYFSVYMHLSKILVKKGQNVNKGDTIGLMGNTGYSFGTHLHISLYKGSYKTENGIDPLSIYK